MHMFLLAHLAGWSPGRLPTLPGASHAWDLDLPRPSFRSAATGTSLRSNRSVRSLRAPAHVFSFCSSLHVVFVLPVCSLWGQL